MSLVLEPVENEMESSVEINATTGLLNDIEHVYEMLDEEDINRTTDDDAELS